MSIMNWFSKPKTDETLRKLVDLAGGDLTLVSRAIRDVRRGDEPADLAKVVSYIVRHRPATAPGQRAAVAHDNPTPAHA